MLETSCRHCGRLFRSPFLDRSFQWHSRRFRHRHMLFTTFSHVLCRWKGVTNFGLGWMSLVVLYWLVSLFLARLFSGIADWTGRYVPPNVQGNFVFIQGPGTLWILYEWEGSGIFVKKISLTSLFFFLRHTHNGALVRITCEVLFQL